MFFSHQKRGEQQPQQPVNQQKQPPDTASLRRWFAAVDKDGSGHITATELQSSLAEGGLNFSLSTVAGIIRQCDTTGSGTISFSEFEQLHIFLASVQDSFAQLPAVRATGRVSLQQVARGLAAAGYDLEPALQKALFTRFDPLKSDSMGLQEYLALALFLRSTNATFRSFDPAGSCVVHLNFPQFMYAALNCV